MEQLKILNKECSSSECKGNDILLLENDAFDQAKSRELQNWKD